MRRALLPAVLAVLLLAAALSARTASAQAISELVMSDEPIPEDYDSWSLFLVCNPAWLLPESQSNLLNLYSQFRAFGGVLGPDHVAVWFWSHGWTWDEPGELHSAIDVVRSSAICSLLDLPLSDSPYVVVATEYPGAATMSDYPESFVKPENYYVLALGDVDAGEAMQMLSSLADAVVAEKVFETDPNTESFWRKWEDVFRNVRAGVVDVASKLRVTINTQFFTLELSGD